MVSPPTGYVSAFVFLFLGIGVRYFIVAGGAYLVVWRWGGDRFRSRRLSSHSPTKAQLRNEIFYSLISSVVFALAGAIVFVAWQSGGTKIYVDISEFGYLYLLVSLPLYLFLHDTYFYFIHRLMHTRALFARVHGVHHESKNPTPWAAFSFHPLEAALEAIILPILFFLIPLHQYAVVVLLTWMTLSSVINHLGYEFFPAAFRRLPIINATHHQLHHRDVRQNFGLYFTYWDQLLGTTHPEYDREDQNRPKGARRAVNG